MSSMRSLSEVKIATAAKMIFLCLENVVFYDVCDLVVTVWSLQRLNVFLEGWLAFVA